MLKQRMAILMLVGLAAVPVFAAHPVPTPTPAPAVTDESTLASTAEATATEESTEMATEESTLEATAEITPEATDMTLVLVGDPVRGKDIFENGFNGAPACANCHSTADHTPPFALAPSLHNIATRGATRVEGMSAPQYIEDSIRHPSDFVVPGFNPIMYGLFAQKYSDQDIADVIAYLMTL